MLIEPWQCKKDNGNYYKVYTPFYKELIRIRKYQPNLKKAVFNKLIKLASSNTLDSLKLLGPKLTWQNIIKEWQVGEQAAAQLLEQFLTTKIKDYKTARDYMSTDAPIYILVKYLQIKSSMPYKI